MSDERLSIAVVGGGIAGLTVAAALSRAGMRCQVYEQAGHVREVGAGIQVAPNAARLLHRLGLEHHLRSVAVRPAAIEMRRWDDDRVLLRTPLGDACEEIFAAPYYAVHRADLHRGLLELLPEGTVHLGMRLTELLEGDDGVELRFENGWRAFADVVVGADGIHSVVRETLVADEPRSSGQTIYRGLVPAERLAFLLDEPKVLLWLGPEQHAVCYPISAGRLVSFGATTPANGWHTESWSAQGQVADLLASYRGWAPELQAVLAAADTVSRWALHDRDQIDRWSTSRVTIAGDAAHPMLPFRAQGANQAIEDAMVLAACLRRATEDGIATCLRRYEDLRKPRTAAIQQASRDNSRLLHLSDGDGQQRRDSAMADESGLRHQEWLFGYDAELDAELAADSS